MARKFSFSRLETIRVKLLNNRFPHFTPLPVNTIQCHGISSSDITLMMLEKH